jgi:hypothetical protein
VLYTPFRTFSAVGTSVADSLRFLAVISFFGKPDIPTDLSAQRVLELPR